MEHAVVANSEEPTLKRLVPLRWFLILCSLLSPAGLEAADFLYVSNLNGPMHRSHSNGSSVVSPFASIAGDLIGYLDVTHEYIYYSDTTNQTLNRVNLDGTGDTVLAGPAQGIASPFGIVRDRTGLFFANGSANRIQHYNLTTGVLTDIVPETFAPRGLHLQGGVLYWVEAGTNQIRSSEDGLIAAVPGVGGSLFDLTVVPSGPGVTIYATARDRVYRINHTSPLPPVIQTVHTGSAASFITGIAYSGSTIYFADGGEHIVYQLPIGSTAATVVHDASTIPGLSQPVGLDLTPFPRIDVADIVTSESDSPAVFTVTLSEPTSCDIQVTFTTAEFTAIEGSDYTATSGTLTIPAGQLSGIIEVPVAYDGLYEADESFRLVLSSTTFGILGDGEATAVISEQGTIVEARKYTWAQNLGWTNWKPEGKGANTLSTCLSGKIWNQNVGWINLGDGSPENGWAYSNTVGTDFGVNLERDGTLTGFAWGQNIGWITFEQTHGRPKLEFATGRFSGYAWSQNCGWLNLGTASAEFLQTDLLEIRDEDRDKIDDAWELAHGADDLSDLNDGTDTDGDGESDVREYAADTDPFDPEDQLDFRLTLLDLEATVDNVEVSWTSSLRRVYDVMECVHLQDPFIPVAEDMPGAEGTLTTVLTEPLSTLNRKFWQVRARRPLAP